MIFPENSNQVCLSLGGVDKIFRDLHDEGLLRTLEARAFAERAAYYLGRINLVHAFREGNGRTQRILIDQLARTVWLCF